jgi:hypothetical protein
MPCGLCVCPLQPAARQRVSRCSWSRERGSRGVMPACTPPAKRRSPLKPAASQVRLTAHTGNQSCVWDCLLQLRVCWEAAACVPADTCPAALRCRVCVWARWGCARRPGGDICCSYSGACCPYTLWHCPAQHCTLGRYSALRPRAIPGSTCVHVFRGAPGLLQAGSAAQCPVSACIPDCRVAAGWQARRLGEGGGSRKARCC